MPRIQLRLADLVSAMLIIGAFPLLATNKPSQRLDFLAIAIALESLAIFWGSMLLSSWRITLFRAAILVHSYAFLAVMGALSVTPSAMQFIFLLLSERADDDIRDCGFRTVIAALLTVSIFIIERRRRKEMRDSERAAE